jgi:hypothetical protein
LTVFLYRQWAPLEHPFPDDTGIVLRYLDHFRQGAFFAYNLGERPVYGVSGFVHGVFSGALAWGHVRPELAVIISNVVGALLFFFFAAKLFRAVFGNTLAAIVATLTLTFASEYISSTFFLGLETPLHLALVFILLHEFCTRGRFFYFVAAVVVISKLDALALVSLLLGCQVLRAGRSGLRTEARRFLLGFVLPFGAWALFATLVFGSPVPQTFVAKHFYHDKASGKLPFLDPLLYGHARTCTVALICALSVLSLPVALYQKKYFHPAPVFCLCAWLTLVQYFVYNPGEQMPWYYTLPETLFLLSAVSFFSLVGIESRQPLAWAALLACSLILISVRRPLTAEVTVRTHRWFDCVEAERSRIGEAAHALTPPGGVVITGFGHIAREQKQGRVVDYLGLNSKFATDRKLDLYRIVADAHPATLVIHGLFDQDFLSQRHFALARTFYATRLSGFMTMNVFTSNSKDEDCAASLLDPGAVHRGCDIQRGLWNSLALTGTRITFDAEDVDNLRGDLLEARFGVVQTTRPQTVEITVQHDFDEEKVTCQVPALPDSTCSAMAATECRVSLGGAGIPPVVKVTSHGERLTIVEPMILHKPRELQAMLER